jgi:hypothetical protein
MGWFNKKLSDNTRLLNLETDVHLLQLKLKSVLDMIDNIEIKILESKKVYQRKLKNLVDNEEKTDNNINQQVLLGPHGNPI